MSTEKKKKSLKKRLSSTVFKKENQMVDYKKRRPLHE